MSYGLVVYALDTDSIRQLGDAEAFRVPRIASSGPVTEAMYRIDDLHGADHPGAEELIGRIARGEAIHDDSLEAVYAPLFRGLCELYGDPLDNSAWYPIAPNFPKIVQAELDRLGVPRDVLDLDRMIYAGAPLPLPRNADFPVIGHLPHPQAERALDILNTINLSGITDRPVRDAVEQLIGWLRACTNLLPRDLVCVYT